MKHKLFTAGMLLLTSMAPALAQDAPANPLEKEGYRLIFHDEFDGTVLDETKWIDDYNPGKQPRKVSATFYEMKDGIISLIINKKSPNNINEYYMNGFISACATITDVDSINQKRSKKTRIPREAPHINQYGYYELRAKAQTGGGVHSAWWMMGIRDVVEQGCEIDMFEILGRNENSIMSTIHPWKDKNVKYHTEYPWCANKKLAEEFHVYGLDWTPEGITVYVDGARVMSHKVSITYPMYQLISFYDNRKPTDNWTGPYDPSVPYPKTFQIDYVRVYKKIPAGHQAVADKDLRITQIEPARLELEEGQAERRFNRPGVHVKGTPSFVHVHYNDGTVTEQSVKWAPLTEEGLEHVKKAGTTIVTGQIKGLSDELLKGQEAVLIINTHKKEK